MGSSSRYRKIRNGKIFLTSYGDLLQDHIILYDSYSTALYNLQLCNFIKDELKVKRRNAYRELLKESNVNVTSNWKEVRRKIKDDIRYQKFRKILYSYPYSMYRCFYRFL